MPADRLAGSWEPCDGSCRRRGLHGRHQAFGSGWGRQVGSVCLRRFSSAWC